MSPERHFFSCSPGQPVEEQKGSEQHEYLEENFQKCVEENSFRVNFGVTQLGVVEEIKKGDILLLRYRDRFVAFGEAEEDYRGIKDEEDPYYNKDGWNRFVKVVQWYFYDNNDKKAGVNRHGIQDNAVPGAGQLATVRGIYPDFALQKLNHFDKNIPLLQTLNSEFSKKK